MKLNTLPACNSSLFSSRGRAIYFPEQTFKYYYEFFDKDISIIKDAVWTRKALKIRVPKDSFFVNHLISLIGQGLWLCTTVASAFFQMLAMLIKTTPSPVRYFLPQILASNALGLVIMFRLLKLTQLPTINNINQRLLCAKELAPVQSMGANRNY